MSYLSDPVRRHVIPLSTLLATLVCGISVSCFVTTELVSLSEEESARTLGVLDVCVIHSKTFVLPVDITHPASTPILPLREIQALW